jgi:NAD(P)-dependent dehydrogenase (short-subunit alcohol dehydrogenase family)
LTLDPTEASEVNNAVEQAQSEFGRLDILINNIDEGIHHQISGLGLESWHKALYINLDPVVLFCREAIPRMRQQHHGRVINILSLNYLGLPETAYYAASKSGIFGFSRALALESAKYDITVNCVVKGDIQDREIAEEEEISQIASGIPCKRMGRPEDIARTVGFFASDTSKYITGQTFFVCGGKSVYFSMSV